MDNAIPVPQNKKCASEVSRVSQMQQVLATRKQ
jgi:hypothetical protein